MKILHTSDWHLGAAEGDRSLAEDQKFFIDEICAIAKENSVEALIIAGDVYDRSVASAEAVGLYDYAMTKLCIELKIKVFIIAGNHDSAERLSSCGELLAASGLNIRGALKEDLSPVTFGDTDFYFLPWITEEKVKSLFPGQKNAINSLEDAYSVVTGKMRETFAPDKRHIIISHAFITGSVTSTSDRAAEIGFATQVPASVFDGFDYAALGHIHKPQSVTSDVRYSGTPMPYSFGKEEEQVKSVTLIDTETMQQTVIPLKVLHSRKTFEGTLDELLHPVCDRETQKGFIRLRVTDCFVGLETLSELRRVYPNLIEVSGKTFESENSSVTLTMEELEKLAEDPTDVFRYFCKEEADTDPDERLIELFKEAVKAAEEEAL